MNIHKGNVQYPTKWFPIDFWTFMIALVTSPKNIYRVFESHIQMSIVGIHVFQSFFSCGAVSQSGRPES